MLIQQGAYQFSEAVILHDRTRGDRVRGVVYLEAWFEPNGGEGGGNGGAAVHAKAIVGKLGDSDENVRKAAVKTLATLSTEALKPHASGIVGKLEQLSGQESQEAVRLLAAKG